MFVSAARVAGHRPQGAFRAGARGLWPAPNGGFTPAILFRLWQGDPPLHRHWLGEVAG
jgi:hypothetical protein